MPSKKYCPRCEETKPVADFGVNRAHSDGLQSYCRRCVAASQKASRERKAEKAPPPKAKAAATPAPRAAAPAYTAPERAPNEAPSQRLDRLKKHATAMKATAQAARVAVRCKLPTATGEVCGEVVMSHRATFHAYEVHKKNVPIDLMGQYFERAQEDAA